MAGPTARGEQLARAALSIYERIAPPTHPDRVLAQLKLAEALHYQGRPAEAAPLFQSALEKTTLLHGRESWRAADILDLLARVDLDLGRTTQAEEYAREALRVMQAVSGAGHLQTAYFHTSLAMVLVVRADYEEARVHALRSLEILSGAYAPDHPYVGSAESALAQAQLGLGDLDAAERTLIPVFERCVRTQAAPWRCARLRSVYGELLHRRGLARDAELILIDSYRTLATSTGAPMISVARA